MCEEHGKHVLWLANRGTSVEDRGTVLGRVPKTSLSRSGEVSGIWINYFSTVITPKESAKSCKKPVSKTFSGVQSALTLGTII